MLFSLYVCFCITPIINLILSKILPTLAIFISFYMYVFISIRSDIILFFIFDIPLLFRLDGEFFFYDDDILYHFNPFFDIQYNWATRTFVILGLL